MIHSCAGHTNTFILIHMVRIHPQTAIVSCIVVCIHRVFFKVLIGVLDSQIGVLSVEYHVKKL